MINRDRVLVLIGAPIMIFSLYSMLMYAFLLSAIIFYIGAGITLLANPWNLYPDEEDTK
jgi:hypothetical protein